MLDFQFARQVDLGWLARLDRCQLRTNSLSFGVHSVYVNCRKIHVGRNRVAKRPLATPESGL